MCVCVCVRQKNLVEVGIKYPKVLRILACSHQLWYKQALATCFPDVGIESERSAKALVTASPNQCGSNRKMEL